MKHLLTREARGFVEGVVSYLKHDDKTKAVGEGVHTMLAKISDQAKREHQAVVQTSVALTHQECRKIEKLIEQLMGHSMQITYELQSDLIGGIRIRVGDWILDTSLQTQIGEMKRLLI